MDTNQLILEIARTLLGWLGHPEPGEARRYRATTVNTLLVIALAIGLGYAWHIAGS